MGCKKEKSLSLDFHYWFALFDYLSLINDIDFVQLMMFWA
jgi:hypothetical protein